MIDIKAKDGKQMADVKIGCFGVLWKVAVVLILVFHFGTILRFIESVIKGC